MNLTCGQGRETHFCPECGTNIWIRYLYHNVAVIAVRAGTLEDTSSATPRAHIFSRRMLPWLEISRGVPAYEQMLVRSEVWSQESIAKYESLPLSPSAR